MMGASVRSRRPTRPPRRSRWWCASWRRRACGLACHWRSPMPASVTHGWPWQFGPPSMRVAAVATRSLGIDTAARRSRRRRVLLEHLVFLQQFCDRRSNSLMRRRRRVAIARDGNDGAFTLHLAKARGHVDQEDAGVLYHRRQPCRQIVDLGIEVDRDPDHDQRRIDRIGRLLHLLQHIGLGFDLVFIGNPLGRAGPIEFCSEEPPVAYGRGQKILHEGGLAVPEPELCSRQRVDRILRQPDGGAGRADGDARPANAEGRSAFEAWSDIAVEMVLPETVDDEFWRKISCGLKY